MKLTIDPTTGADPYLLTGRELDTILAALRLWQLGLAQEAVPPELQAIAANGAVPLTVEEVDAVAERLTFAGFAEAARRREGKR